MRQTVVLVFLAACSRGSSGAPADAAAVGDPAPAVDAVAPASSTAAEDAEAPSRVLHYRASLATFSDDLLDECADIYVDVTPPADAGVDWKPTIDPAEEMAKRSPNATRLTQKCREQFADRTMLAFCKATLPVQVTPGGAAIEATFLSSYFSYATVERPTAT